MQTLRDVHSGREQLLSNLNENQHEKELFDDTEMNGVVVIPDDIARRYLEADYVEGTQFVPNGLPGIGESKGDVIEHEGKTYMTVDATVYYMNLAAFQLFRRDEAYYMEWMREREGLEQRVQTFFAALKKANPGAFGIKQLQAPEKWDETFVGQRHIGTPTPEFLQGLDTLKGQIPREKDFAELLHTTSTLAEDLRKYVAIRDVMANIRKETGHRGFPQFSDDMLQIHTPAYSGGGGIHTHCTDDDVSRARASYNDLTIIASQAKKHGKFFGHIGGGELQGEGYIFLPPKTPFFQIMQERIGNSPDLEAKWKQMAKETEIVKAASLWHNETREEKREVVKEIVPPLIQDRVLGFHYDMRGDGRTLKVHPVVAKAALENDVSFLRDSGWEALPKEWHTLLYQMDNSYCGIKSVFEEE